MISNSGQDSHGKYSGDVAGDQNGREWSIIPWYNRPWNVVLRHPDEKVRDLIAELAREAAENDLIGYDQNERTTFWSQLKVSGYHPKGIKKACEADCSAGVSAIVKACGYLLQMDALKAVSQDAYTGNLRKVLAKAGFKELTDSKYLASDSYLLKGDILLYENHHTAINLDDGAKTDNPTYISAIGTDRKGLRVTTTINIRSGAGTEYPTVGMYLIGDRIFPIGKCFVNNAPWIQTDKGFISGKYLDGWVSENGGWWYLEEGYTYPMGEEKEIEGMFWMFDHDGWMLENGRINDDGSIKY